MMRLRLAVAFLTSALFTAGCTINVVNDLTLSRLEVVEGREAVQDWPPEVRFLLANDPHRLWMRVHVRTSANFLDIAQRIGFLETRVDVCDRRDVYTAGVPYVFWHGRTIRGDPRVLSVEPEQDGLYEYYLYLGTRYVHETDPMALPGQGPRVRVEMSEHPADICVRIVNPRMVPPVPGTNEIRIPAERIGALLGASAPP